MSEREGIARLTAEDVPELDDSEFGTSDKYYCRIFEQDAWGYWKQISCSGNVASENDCAWKVPKDGAYGWTRRPC
ncbi:hypothetical protein C6W92_03350 [Roseovarius sp. A46]|uniref:hypothetical protein n=1 Tax=Roseovarius sp. A46 TaxID=2109331 RepID=UPI001011375F|nr:hypothetical protein [Roseovarius sp. A46]RXV66514.1 hypothetical protein C6W92_03350 [Roseovarius sp. A46]